MNKTLAKITPKPATRRKRSRIEVGQGLPAKKPTKFPFDSLVKPGDYFIVKGRDDERSCRVQCSKQLKSRGVRYTVTRLSKGDELSNGKLITEDGFMVLLVEYAQ